jgi:hypothetical protein
VQRDLAQAPRSGAFGCGTISWGKIAGPPRVEASARADDYASGTDYAGNRGADHAGNRDAGNGRAVANGPAAARR